MSNVVYEWNSICDHSARKVAEESVSRDCMSGFAGEYEEGDDWVDRDEPYEEEITEEDLGLITGKKILPVMERAEYMTPEQVEEELRELTDVAYYLYKECIEEGFSQREAIKETYKRFWE